MKKVLVIIACLYVVGINAQCPRIAHVIITMGQSNAGSPGGLDALLLPPVPPNLYIWTVDNATFANPTFAQNEPLQFGVNTDAGTTRYGPGEIAALYYAIDNPDIDVFVFKHYRNGAPLHDSPTNLDFSATAVNELRDKFAIEWPLFVADLQAKGFSHYSIIAIPWIQGEGDNAQYMQYAANFLDYKGFIEGTINQSPPWLMWSLTTRQFVSDPIRNPRIIALRNIQLNELSQIQGVRVYDTENLPGLLPDEVHHNNASIIQGGTESYFNFPEIWER